MIPLQNPESKYDEDYHRHDFYVEEGKGRLHVATIEFDDLTDERGGIWCEVTVWAHVGASSDEPVVAFQRVNLLTSFKATIDRAERGADAVNWNQGFDTAVFRTINQFRSTSSTTEWMERREATEEDSPYLLEPFIARTGVTILFGPKGAGKSTFALRLAYAIASGEGFYGHKPTEVGPVMYLDFEDTMRPHEFRLSAMTDGDLTGLIRHVRITKSLKDTRRLLRKMVRDDEVALVILDSVALARAADVSGSEATIKMFKTLAQLGVPVLAIDHMTKEDNKAVAMGTMDARKASPIGSQFTESSARMAWFMNKLPQSTAGVKVYNLINTKMNHGPEHTPIGMKVTIEQGEFQQMKTVTFKLEDHGFDSVVAELGKRTKPQELLVWHYRQQGENNRVIPMTARAMEQSGIKGSTIRGALTENPWWEQLAGSKEYTLSTHGLEAATYFNSMFGQTGTNEGD